MHAAAQATQPAESTTGSSSDCEQGDIGCCCQVATPVLGTLQGSTAEVQPVVEDDVGDDFTLSRVPSAARYSWPSIALEDISMCGCNSNVLLGAVLGSRMDFATALWAIALGTALLASASVVLGWIGCREGLTTPVLSYWAGFGKSGSIVFSLLVAVSLMGWFGIQSAIAGEGLENLCGGMPVWAWTIVSGAAVTIISYMGFSWMVVTAWITAPAFLVVIVWAVANSLSQHTLADILGQQPQGDPLSFFHGVDLVVGGGALGVTISSDVFRFSRSNCGVTVAVILGRSPALFFYISAGALAAVASQSSSIIVIMKKEVGWAAVVVVVAGGLAINCLNLYCTGLAFANVCQALAGSKGRRRVVTLGCGLVGTGLGSAGLLKHFTSFLEALSVTFPPVAGILVCEYYFVRAFRGALDESRGRGCLPPEVPTYVPTTLLVWAAAAVLGGLVVLPWWGMPCLWSFLGAAAFYAVVAWADAPCSKNHGTAERSKPRITRRATDRT